jgi:ferredoxin
MADRHAIDIDRIRCDGFGMCAELLPELIELDDWGYPIIRPGDVPDDLLRHARMAVEACPVLAITLRRRQAVAELRLAAERRVLQPGYPGRRPGAAAREAR